MFDWGITLEEEIEIRVEEAAEETYLKAAMRFIKRGLSIQEVADTLELTDYQTRELDKLTAQNFA